MTYMKNKKGQGGMPVRLIIIIIIALVVLTVGILFFTGQWERIVGALTGIEEGVIADVPPTGPGS